VPYEVSERANAEIAELYEYGFIRFGVAQADRYVAGLFELFDLLGGQPLLGRRLSSKYRVFFYRSHVVLYSNPSEGVMI
jgi:toxin ParE1/3/4